MENIILVIHVLAAASVIGLVLLQHGKGADMGAAFGSGASGSLFGVSGSSNLLSNLTAIFTTIFFITSLTLAYMSSHRSGGSVVKSAIEKAVPASANVTDVQPAVKPLENTAKDIPN